MKKDSKPMASFLIRNILLDKFSNDKIKEFSMTTAEIKKEIVKSNYQEGYIKFILESYFKIKEEKGRFLFSRKKLDWLLAKKRIRKSQRLSSELMKGFLKYINSFDTKIDCAESLNMSRVTLDNII